MKRLWWACEYPERPPDALVTWHYRYDDYGKLAAAPADHEPAERHAPQFCRGCAVKAEAQLSLYPDDQIAAWAVFMVTGVEPSWPPLNHPER